MVALGTGHEYCKVITHRNGTKSSCDPIQLEENEQLSVEEVEPAEVTTTIPHATTTIDKSLVVAMTSPHVATIPSNAVKLDEMNAEADLENCMV
ncbi:hypothetical protein V6N12_016843 [Hibiscus sabdariffa]|uniref:Uncharacterized protein n=1 Tax=Hibiscus sabdariffa TaxID=183260 RepID=A0ABR2BPC2_9ROSI